MPSSDVKATICLRRKAESRGYGKDASDDAAAAVLGAVELTWWKDGITLLRRMLATWLTYAVLFSSSCEDCSLSLSDGYLL